MTVLLHEEHASVKPFGNRAYFNGYALWTYLTTPFLPAMPDLSDIRFS
ncbi:hypothetical protein [Streptomyces sp. RB17]|nr:hypothetical protein [Streptomyces sp. RB17]